MFPEELKERYHAVATHVSNLISAQNRLLNPFNFSQDRVIVVVRSVAPTFTLLFSLSLLFLPLCRFNSGKKSEEKERNKGQREGMRRRWHPNVCEVGRKARLCPKREGGKERERER